MSKVAADKAVVKMNGKAITAPFATQVGDIFEVGFVCQTAGAFTISAPTVERRVDACLGMQSLDEIRVFGDSTAETLPSSWDQLLRPLLDGTYGVRVRTVVNKAVSGATLDDQFALMQQPGMLGNAYFVVVAAGTNNVQGLQDIGTWKALVSNVADYLLSQGRRPIFVVPWMWYGQAQGGGSGQPAANYDKAAPYRQWMERIAYEKGVALVKLPEELPNPSPGLLSTEPSAPLLRDNIHQDALAHEMEAQVLAKAILDEYCSLPGAVEETPAAALMLNGATVGTDLRVYYDKSGLAGITGTMSVTTISDGTALMRLPRYLAPRRPLNILVMALGSTLNYLGTCWVFVDPVAGALKLTKAPANTTMIIFSGGSWQTASSAV